MPSPSGLPDAANGTDLAACRDADCEVEVTVNDELPIDGKFGIDLITVTTVGADRVRLGVLGTAGGLEVEGLDVSASGSCTNGNCRDVGELSLTTEIDGRINDILLSLGGLDGERAVLVLRQR